MQLHCNITITDDTIIIIIIIIIILAMEKKTVDWQDNVTVTCTWEFPVLNVCENLGDRLILLGFFVVFFSTARSRPEYSFLHPNDAVSSEMLKCRKINQIK